MNKDKWRKEFDEKFGIGDVVSRTDMGDEFDGFRYDEDLKQFIKKVETDAVRGALKKIRNYYNHPHHSKEKGAVEEAISILEEEE